MEMNKLKTKIFVTTGFLLVILGFSLIFSNYFTEKVDTVYESFNVKTFTTETEEVPEPVEQTETATNISQGTEEFLGTLEIEKINLKNGFYEKASQLNNVNRNVTIINESNYPDEKNGNTILIAHSGSSYLGYFKNLYQLGVGDTAKVTFKGTVYNYKITKIYNENKDGNVTIYKPKNKTTLTLITCTKDDNTKQTVYIAERF